ncbi:MAG: hypothetical protein ABSC23_20640 [Bryobacteraceae bacterium]
MLRLVLLVCALAATAGAADRLQQTLGKMDQAAALFKGLTAGITKVHYTFVIQESDEQKGTIVVRRPKPKDMQVLLDIKEPAPQQVQLLARTVRIYDPAKKSGQEVPLDRKYGSLVNEYMLLGFGSSPTDLQQTFTIGRSESDAIGGRPATKIELTPKKVDTALHLIRAELWISDETGVALQQQFHYAGGDYDLVTYSNMKLADVPESAVQLNAPRNIKWENPLK